MLSLHHYHSPKMGDMKKKVKILELGSGKRPYEAKEGEEVIHLDKVKLPDVEVVWDLNKFPWPFKDNEFDVVIARHVLEHLDDLINVMGEIWRILKPRGILKVWVPYFSSVNAFSDLTHRHFFTLHTFDYFEPNSELHHEVGFTFKVLKKELKFGRASFLGKLVYKINPYIYERFLSFIFPAFEIYFELEVLK